MLNNNSVKITRYIFLMSGLYGFAILPPQLFREKGFAQLNTSRIFMDFLVALVILLLFLIISINPIRHWYAILPGFISKGGYFTNCILLFFNNRLAKDILIASLFDLLMLTLSVYNHLRIYG